MVKTRLVELIFGCVFATTGWAATSSPSLIATPPQPTWSELTVQQKIVLAPLSDDWDSLAFYRQKKWLGIVGRFATMTPEEQRRVQVQMQGWGKLTPEQRQTARDNFQAASHLSEEKKKELKLKWEEYSNLPEDEKEQLKLQAANKPVPKPGRPAISPTLTPASPAIATPPATETASPAGAVPTAADPATKY